MVERAHYKKRMDNLMSKEKMMNWLTQKGGIRPRNLERLRSGGQ